MSVQRTAIPELGRVFRGETVSGLSEWQLLERYRERRDESAFEALVTRHGPMVLGVCRRMLGGSPDADDAFQATFLILVRRARDLGPRDAIGPWLHGVAARVAARARSQASRRRQQCSAPLEFTLADRCGSTIDPDLVEVLDLELSRLPGKYRSPIVLCYLEGRTHEEAARDLDWPVGTVKGRLARARELLRSRLTRRGFSPTAGVVGVLSSPELITVLDRPLAERTVAASVKLAAGQSTAHVVSQTVTSLVEGVLSAMFRTKIKWAALAAVATGFAVTSAAVVGRQDAASKPAESKTSASTGKPVLPIEEFKSQVDDQKPAPPAEGGEKPDAATILARRRSGAGLAPQLAEPDLSRGNDPRSHRIIARLEDPIMMSFPAETPLDDVLKYIKQATTTPTHPGIPIYVDPIGLQEAERSMNSTVQIDLEGVPLRRTLQLILSQLGLAYFVEDGMLVITSPKLANEPLPPTMTTLGPIHKMIEKSERGELNSEELKELVEVIRLRRMVKRMHENYDAPEGGGGGGGGGGGFGGDRGATGASGKVFPGEENVSETRELLKEVRELVKVLKGEKPEKKKEPEKRGGGLQ